MSKIEVLIIFKDSYLQCEDQRNFKIIRILCNFPSINKRKVVIFRLPLQEHRAGLRMSLLGRCRRPVISVLGNRREGPCFRQCLGREQDHCMWWQMSLGNTVATGGW